uniref:Mitochondrial distribution and morphology protein 10 n=1 Tax=Schizosaccharomyces japonicus (strain yFS275 / FY16936) TaxID=402676 RepID=MDM10_SCHJY|nr:RecName: Full=Mitochondrial distribution and morphology protein 10; AltName: Full=Mitochondrial inheritance component mdm10 [Schizosaccharomyces japonicus yFS275]
MNSFTRALFDEYLRKTGWNRGNLYTNLTQSADEVLNLEIPSGINCDLSSIPSPNFASNWEIQMLPILNGSVSYLYSNVDLRLPQNVFGHFAQHQQKFQHLLPPYRHLKTELTDMGFERKPYLMFGKLHLPTAKLEAIFAKRISPPNNLIIRMCHTKRGILTSTSTLLHWQRDTGRSCTEILYSTDEAMIGFRKLWNSGRLQPSLFESANLTKFDPFWSVGAEVYYGALTKCVGASIGARLYSCANGVHNPYSVTCTLNPIVGHLVSTFATSHNDTRVLCSQFEFNLYSYESRLRLGMELFQRKRLLTNEDNHSDDIRQQGNDGVLRLSVSTDGDLVVAWNGQLRDFLYTVGTKVHMLSINPVFFGIHFQYSH